VLTLIRGWHREDKPDTLIGDYISPVQFGPATKGREWALIHAEKLLRENKSVTVGDHFTHVEDIAPWVALAFVLDLEMTIVNNCAFRPNDDDDLPEKFSIMKFNVVLEEKSHEGS
jgi:hypothetical protein